MKRWSLFTLLALLAFPTLSQAQDTNVYFDTDNGPILVRLDTVRAPITSNNFLSYVDEGFYDNLAFHRVIQNFVVQSGGFDSNLSARNPSRPAITSERTNGRTHTAGTISMALLASGSTTNVNSAQAGFFINLVPNDALNGTFTVFGDVIFGVATLQRMNAIRSYSNDVPTRPTLIRRAVRTNGFPVMNLHTGSWFDPANPRRGFVIEIAKDASSDTGPIAVVYWYDYLNGQQIWATGSTSFAFGASEITIPLLRTEGAQFGPAFDPNAVVVDSDWGNLTLQFTSCTHGLFSFQTAEGDGEYFLTRLTVPGNDSCMGG